jgi:hypothetical protein
MYANNIIIAKDTLGNEWEFGNLSCASSSENLSYANLTDIKWSGTELTLSHNGVTRSFYFNTPTDAAHISDIIKSVSQNPEKYNRANSLDSGDDYLENADIRNLLVETVIHQRNIDKKLKTVTTILYIWITIVIVSIVISLLAYFSAIYNISTLYSNYNGTQIENIREYNQNENQNNDPYEDEDTQSDEDYNLDNN